MKAYTVTSPEQYVWQVKQGDTVLKKFYGDAALTAALAYKCQLEHERQVTAFADYCDTNLFGFGY